MASVEFRATMTQASVLADQLVRVLEAADAIIESDEYPSLGRDVIYIVCTSFGVQIHAYIRINETLYMRCGGDFTNDVPDLITLGEGDRLWEDTDTVYTIRAGMGDEYTVSTIMK